MNKILFWPQTLLFLPPFVFVMLAFDVFMRVCKPWPKAYDYVLAGLCRSVLILLKVTGFSWKIINAEKLNKLSDKPVLVISNHQSIMDIPMLYLTFRKFSPRFIAKKELGKFIPFASVALRLGKHAMIDRKSKALALSEISAFAEFAKENKHAVIIFPEGTRAKDGHLKEFKPSGVVSLVNSFQELNLVKVKISNAYKLMKYNFLPLVPWVDVAIEILEIIPVQAKEFSAEKVAEIRKDIQAK